MGEREPSIVLSDNNSFEEEDNIEQKYDDRYEIAENLIKDRDLAKIENDFLSGAINRDYYLEEVNAIKDKLLSRESEDSELREVIEMVFSSILVVQSECLRLKEDSDRSEKNLALRETKWQIDIADYYWEFKNDSTTLPIVNLCLDRLAKTHRLLNLDESEIEKCMRGFKGMLATLNACDQLGYQVKFPTPELDAEGKVDLMIGIPGSKKWFACQIKTAWGETIEPDVVNASIIANMPDKDGKAARILISSAKELSRNEGGLTYEPIWITIPELLIVDSSFVPQKSIINTIGSLAGRLKQT